MKFLKFVYATRKRIVCTRLYHLSIRLYLKGFGDTALFSFSVTLPHGTQPFYKISQNGQRHSKENRLYPFVPPFNSFVPQRNRKCSFFNVYSRGEFR